MTHFRLRWQKLGGHVHVNVWSGTDELTTHGRNGTLTFRENEWEDFVKALQYVDNFEIIPQEFIKVVPISEPIETPRSFDDHSELY